MKVAFCSSEVFPFAKTGGLADVSGALPFALAKTGCSVKVFMPWYKNIRPQRTYDGYGASTLKGVEIIFVRHDGYFARDSLYGTPQGDYPDNLERFTFYSAKTIELFKKMKFRPDIVHCNDWQAAAIIIYLRTNRKNDIFFKNTKTVLTIHNLAYQGIFPREKYPTIGISWDYFNMRYFEYYGKINLLKGGIVCADMVNTVSPTYASQIQSAEYGCGLDGVLKEKGARLCGILNAIDYAVWDPKKDPFLYKKYSSVSLEHKAVNKARFQKELGLECKKGTLLLGMVSRLAEQKGVDILSRIAPALLKKHMLVILGFGDEKYHKMFSLLEKKHKKRFSLNLAFDERLAHRIYACCDAFLMPSRFEPCGLSQMISYKYATVPIVHSTGGLTDTVVDYAKGGGGVVFNEYSPGAFSASIDRARMLFGKKREWAALLKKISRYNFSWSKTAKEYQQMYGRC